jgi:hypothetical protein
MAKITRKMRFEYRMTNAAATRRDNAVQKTAERSRRDARMFAKVKAGSLPYPPDVMSWISRKLEMPSHKITAADLKKLAAAG